MLSYIGIKIKQYSAVKYLVFGSLMLCCALLAADFFNVYAESVFELLLIVLCDKLFVSIAFTLLAIIFVNNMFTIEPREIQLMTRLKSTLKWYICNLSATVIMVIIFTLLYFGIIISVGAASGYSFSGQWSESATMQMLMTGSCFDPNGLPFLGLVSIGTSPVAAVVWAFVMFIFRCVFWILLANTIAAISKNRLVGLAVAILLNFLDVFLAGALGEAASMLMPHMHSMVGTINDMRPAFLLSVIYWCVLAVGTVFIGYQFEYDMNEKLVISLTADSQ